MKAHVIHGKHRPDRFQSLNDELRFQNVEFEIFDGIFGDDSISCASKSHRTCVSLAPPGNVCVMEDDVVFSSSGAFKRFTELMPFLPDDWNIFLAGAYGGKIELVAQNICKMDYFSGLHCYIVRDSFRELFCSMSNGHLDIELSRNSNCYVAYPLLASQRDGWSDISKKMCVHKNTHPLWNV